MLRNLTEGRLPSKFLLIADSENATGQDLFVSILKNHIVQESTAKINLICYESPPESYLPASPDEKIVSYNFFTDPCGWKDPSAPKSDLGLFISNNTSPISETTFFIDSLSHLVRYHGYCSTYKALSALKQNAQKTVCLLHHDLFSPEQVEELYFLATAFITVQQVKGKRMQKEKLAQVVYKKSGGKVIKQEEAFSIDDELSIVSRVGLVKKPAPSSGKEDMEDLTTFKLGLHMSEKERKAKDELILPYLNKSRAGDIIYQPEADELEEDPDDDLDI